MRLITLTVLLLFAGASHSASGFRAYKSAYQYMASSPAYQRIDFPTAKSWSVGYNTQLSRWTPPAGMVNISAQIWLIQGTNWPTPYTSVNIVVKIQKNGLQFENEVGTGLCTYGLFKNTGANQQTAVCTVPGFVDQATGSDYYELVLYTNTVDTIIDPNPGHTYFNGLSVQ